MPNDLEKVVDRVEREILRYTSDIWNRFNRVDQTHPSDLEDMANAIHDIQKIISVRMARRKNPKLFITIKEEE